MTSFVLLCIALGFMAIGMPVGSGLPSTPIGRSVTLVASPPATLWRQICELPERAERK